METKLVHVTPGMARHILMGNTRNRPLRPSHVARLRLSFERGEYRQTHQGIAVAVDGTVIDGQHRLTAISQMADGYSFPMLVSSGLDFEEAFSVVDAVAVPRTASDVLGMDRKVVEVASFLCRLTDGTTNGVTPLQVVRYVEFTAPVVQSVIDFCGTCRKTWASATVRAAAVVCILRGIDADYVKSMYRALVMADFELMTPVVRGLFKSNLTGKVRSSDRYDLFVRCLRAFNPKNAEMVKIQINDASSDISAVRSWLQSEMKSAPTEAGAKRSDTRRKSNRSAS